MPKNVLRVFLGTLLLLTVPFLLMQFQVQLPDPGSTPGVLNWDLFDFVVMGILIFFTGLALDFAWRKADKKYRLAVLATIVIGFFLVWAELAVGVFGTPFAGS